MARTKPGAHRASYEKARREKPEVASQAAKASASAPGNEEDPHTPRLTPGDALSSSNNRTTYRDLPRSVLDYLSDRELAHQYGFEVVRPSPSVYLSILESWHLFSGDPHSLQATKFDLGREWFDKTYEAWREEFRRWRDGYRDLIPEEQDAGVVIEAAQALLDLAGSEVRSPVAAAAADDKSARSGGDGPPRRKLAGGLRDVALVDEAPAAIPPRKVGRPKKTVGFRDEIEPSTRPLRTKRKAVVIDDERQEDEDEVCIPISMPLLAIVY